MENSQNTPEPSPGCEIVSTRIINYPRELVWKAYTDPTHVAMWWGPKGFTNTFHEFDFKVGGNWRYIMHGPNGGNYNNHSIFTEIVKLKRLALDRVTVPLFKAVTVFEDESGKTKITYRMIFKTAEECNKVKNFAGSANEENFDRLEEELRSMG